MCFLRGLGGSRMDLQGDKRPPALAFQPGEGLLARKSLKSVLVLETDWSMVIMMLQDMVRAGVDIEAGC